MTGYVLRSTQMGVLCAIVRKLVNRLKRWWARQMGERDYQRWRNDLSDWSKRR